MVMRPRQRRTLGHLRVGILGVALVLAGALNTVQNVHVRASSLPGIGHVWVVVLENESESTSFAGATYLATTLKSQGAFIPGYYAIGHESLPNYVGLISGQGPEPDTQGDCQIYQDMNGNGAPGNYGQQGSSTGCVYASPVKTVGDQLVAAGHTWKGYMEDLGNDPNHENISCDNAASAANPGTRDMTQSAEAQDQYAIRHDPFMYFHSIIDSSSCKTNLVRLQDSKRGLKADLQAVGTTPNLSLVVPNLCDDGHDGTSQTSTTCAGPDAAGKNNTGLAAIDDWLSMYIPPIVASPAFQKDGMLVITFDESTMSDTAFCCNEDKPGSANPGITGTGGGQVGAIVLSPFVRPGTTSSQEYNHYSLLRTIEDMFHTTGGWDGHGHLGFAGGEFTGYPGPCQQATNTSPCQADFGGDVFSDPSGTSRPKVVPGGTSTPNLNIGSGVIGPPGSTGVSPLPPEAVTGGGGTGPFVVGGTLGATPPDVAISDGDAPSPIHSLHGPELASAEASPLGLVLLLVLAPLMAVAGSLVLFRRRGGGG